MYSLGKRFFCVVIVIFICCSQTADFSYWPANGLCLQDITWEVALSDSANVLTQKDGCWVLPDPPKDASPVSVCHKFPEKHVLPELFNQTDQVVRRETGGIIEYYCFQNSDVSLLGFETPDSTRLYTVYDPPLVVFKPFGNESSGIYLTETRPLIYNAVKDSFQTDYPTRLKIIRIRAGFVMMDSVKTPALLYRLIMSSDRTVGFAGTDLILPDAVTMESRILFAESMGPVLEWGIRSRSVQPDPSSEIIPGLDEMSMPQDVFIEVTRHIRAGPP